jgi:hypothetical protein
VVFVEKGGIWNMQKALLMGTILVLGIWRKLVWEVMDATEILGTVTSRGGPMKVRHPYNCKG